MNKTKIVATIGPASSSKEKLRELIIAGMDVVRINLDHCDRNFCEDIVEKISTLNKELGTNVATLFDTKGPEIRTGKFINGNALLETGSKIRVYMNEIVGDSTKFSVSYPKLLEEIYFDAIIKIDDGHLTLKVIDKGVDYLLCEVVVGGIITDNKGVNVPGADFNMPFLSEKDKDDILMASELGADFIALSFVNSHEDVLEVNDMLINIGNDHMGIISKIENEKAYEDIDEIIKISDGVMVARGDLGVEIPMERVPGIQKAIITKCHLAGKVSIVATEMMSSMEEDIIPTRAEVSDVANAVLDGTDAVMLSGETTTGMYPVETVTMMNKIIENAELDVDYLGFMDRAMRTETKDITGMLAHSVAYNSAVLDCKAIFAPTISGYTARKISRFRPRCTIIAATPDPEAARALALNFGVQAILIGELKTFERIIEVSKKLSKDFLDLKDKDKIIITGGYPFKEVKHTNFMKIEEI